MVPKVPLWSQAELGKKRGRGCLGCDKGHEDGAGGVNGKEKQAEPQVLGQIALRGSGDDGPVRRLPGFDKEWALLGIMAMSDRSLLSLLSQDSLVSTHRGRSCPYGDIFRRNKYKNEQGHPLFPSGRCFSAPALPPQ